MLICQSPEDSLFVRDVAGALPLPSSDAVKGLIGRDGGGSNVFGTSGGSKGEGGLAGLGIGASGAGGAETGAFGTGAGGTGSKFGGSSIWAQWAGWEVSPRTHQHLAAELEYRV
jgi:hypothetical protein